MVAAQVLNKPVGVVYESEYHLMVVDICIGKMDIILLNVLFQKFRGLRLLFLRNGVEDSSFWNSTGMHYVTGSMQFQEDLQKMDFPEKITL